MQTLENHNDLAALQLPDDPIHHHTITKMDNVPFSWQPKLHIPNRSFELAVHDNNNNNNNNNNKYSARKITTTSTPTTPKTTHIPFVPGPYDAFTPGPYDILCGRTSNAYNHVGNRRFRVTVSLNLQRYQQAKNRYGRTQVITTVVRLLREVIGARFLKKTRGNVWVELDESKAREKVGHALSDMTATSTSTQQQQQQQQQQKQKQKQKTSIDDLEEESKMIFETTDKKSSDVEEPIEDQKTILDITKSNIFSSSQQQDILPLLLLPLDFSSLDSLLDVFDDGDEDDHFMDHLQEEVFQYLAEKA
jgi:hypothetical protein